MTIGFLTNISKPRLLISKEREVLMIFRMKWCRWGELNSRPHPYQGCALPLSYSGQYFARRIPARWHGGPIATDSSAMQGKSVKFLALLKPIIMLANGLPDQS